MLSYKSGIIYAKKCFEGLDLSACRADDFLFSKYTTYGLGGGAREVFFPRNFVEARAVWDYLNPAKNYCNIQSGGAEKNKFFILANGSNLLASDRFYDGSVICTKRLCGIVRTGENEIFCAAGTLVSKILSYCLKHGLGGLEYLCGIPATIGGIAYMNGGAGGIYINSNVISVSLYNGKKYNLSNENCKFGYKYSTMRDINALILGVKLSVSTSLPDEVASRIKCYAERRRALPNGRSCGCVFKNPSGVSAGKLIQDCNLAGLKIGGAYVSREHCNFIINDGARAEDVKKLISLVASTVYKNTGIKLQEEVVYIGEFNETDG